MKIILKGNPISNNSIYKRGKGKSFYMTDKAEALKNDYAWQAVVQVGNKELLSGKLEVKIKLYFEDKRKHDIDNYGKLLLDSISGIVYDDDSQIIKMQVEKFHDRENPRIEIELKELK